MTYEHEKDGKEHGDERGKVGISMHSLKIKRSKLKLDTPQLVLIEHKHKTNADAE